MNGPFYSLTLAKASTEKVRMEPGNSGSNPLGATYFPQQKTFPIGKSFKESDRSSFGEGMADFAGDLKYSKKSAIAYVAASVALGAVLLIFPTIEPSGISWMLLSYVLGPILFGYAGFLAAKGGKAIADSAVSGLIVGAAGSLAFSIFSIAYISATATAGGAANIAPMMIAMIMAYAYMVAFTIILGAICGAIGGFAATKIGGKKEAQQPQAPSPIAAPPVQPQETVKE